ncbi:MAG: DUF5665 domain-containing protein [Candidatus Margulisiibacteriota bacterium]
MTDKTLREALENLSKKRHLLTDEAIKAKDNYDKIKAPEAPASTSEKQFKKNLAVLEEFNDSVHMLSSIFRKSKFDELALFLSQPGRVFIINFFIGIVRGVGFAVGCLMITFLMAYLVKESVTLAHLHHWVVFIKTLFLKA